MVKGHPGWVRLNNVSTTATKLTLLSTRILQKFCIYLQIATPSLELQSNFNSGLAPVFECDRPTTELNVSHLFKAILAC